VKLALTGESAPKSAAMRSTPQFDLVLHVPKAQEEAQNKRLAKEKDQLLKNIASSQRQFPAKVIETIRLKLADYEAQLRKIDNT
jgi:hypothetical protein